MHYDALTRAQRTLYHEATARSHRREVELVLIRRRDGKRIGSLTNRFLGGSIQGDEERTPVTVLECDVLDEGELFDFKHGAHRRYSVQVIDRRFVVALDDWVEREVFTGPLYDFDRQGVVVSLRAEGPEWNAMGSVRDAENWPARTKAHRVQRELLRSAGAEGRDLSIPSMKASLPRDVTVGVKRGKRKREEHGWDRRRRRRLHVDLEDTYWGVALEIADGVDRDLFGDGAGRLVQRRPKSRPSFRFTERMLVAEPVERRADDGEQTNTWIGLGANPKGPRKRVRVKVGLPRRHSSSAFAQRWNGTPREVIETLENPHWRTKAQARRRLERKRDRAKRETTSYDIEAVPVLSWIRPGMVATAPGPGGRVSSRARRWSLPLGPGPDPLTIGTNRVWGWSR